MKATRTIKLTLLAAVSATSLAACDEEPTIRRVRSDPPPSASVQSPFASAAPTDAAPPAPVPDPGSDRMFGDAAACAEETDAATCADAAARAREEHARTAPRSPGREACEATGTECVEDPDSPGLFLPVMAGFLLGRALGGGSVPQAAPLYAGLPPDCRTAPQSPECRGRSGGGGGSAGGAAYLYGRGGYYGAGTFTPSSRGAVALARPPGVAPAFAPSPASSFGRGAATSPGVSSVSRGGFGGAASAHSGGAS